MASVSCIVVLFMILVTGNADILSKTILDRIEDLERKDMEKTIRIELLEKQALVSNGKMNLMSASNHDIHESLENQAKTLQDQEDIIQELRKEVEHYKTVAERSKRNINFLKFKLSEMTERIGKVVKVNAKGRETQQEELEEIKQEERKGEKQKDKIQAFEESGHKKSFKLSSELASNIENRNNEPDYNYRESDEANLAKTKFPNTDPEKAMNILNKADRDTSHGTVDEHYNESWNHMWHEDTVRSTGTGRVAFHAVKPTGSKQVPRINDAIKFDDVHLNIGNGYHDRHGLFIAPQPGLYLFSTSIMPAYEFGHNAIQASVVKNGNKLGRVFCTSYPHLAESMQSSVTVITQLNLGDEVWVRYDWPADAYIWGNGFTSFTGILIN